MPTTNFHLNQHLSPAEAAAKLHITPKALKLYERHGLIRPLRAANGYRTYGPADISRLHQVLALKRLGLPLTKIAILLRGKQASLDATLAIQEAVLGREAERVGHALSLIRAARTRLAAGERLSVDDLVNLTMETTMPAKPTQAETEELFKQLKNKHFSDEDRALLSQQPYDQAAVTAAWDVLISEAKALMAKDDSSSPAALDLARRWKALVEQFTGGNPVLHDKLRAVWRDAQADAKIGPTLPITPELMAFVGKILARA